VGWLRDGVPSPHTFKAVSRNPFRSHGLEWTEPGSNRRPKDFQSFALPAELSVRSLPTVGLASNPFRITLLGYLKAPERSRQGYLRTRGSKRQWQRNRMECLWGLTPRRPSWRGLRSSLGCCQNEPFHDSADAFGRHRPALACSTNPNRHRSQPSHPAGTDAAGWSITSAYTTSPLLTPHFTPFSGVPHPFFVVCTGRIHARIRPRPTRLIHTRSP
jgi:hypothetical protein